MARRATPPRTREQAGAVGLFGILAGLKDGLARATSRAGRPVLPPDLAVAHHLDMAGVRGPASVLLVEDDPGQRQALRALFGRRNLALCEACSDVEAFQLYCGRHFDAVVLNLTASPTQRLATIRAIRALERAEGRRHTRIVVLTPSPRRATRRAAEAAGADDHIIKPAPREQLIASVTQGLPRLSPAFAGPRITALRD